MLGRGSTCRFPPPLVFPVKSPSQEQTLLSLDFNPNPTENTVLSQDFLNLNLSWFRYLTFQNLLVLPDIFITKILAVLPA